MGEWKLRIGVNWQGALSKKQTDIKQGLGVHSSWMESKEKQTILFHSDCKKVPHLHLICKQLLFTF